MRQRTLVAGISLALLLGAPLCYADEPSTRPTVNSSVTIAAGNTFQTVLAASTLNNRRSLTIQNNNATDSCWVFIGPLASATKGTSILLLAGGSYTRYYPYIPSDVVAATCVNTNDTLYVDTN